MRLREHNLPSHEIIAKILNRDLNTVSSANKNKIAGIAFVALVEHYFINHAAGSNCRYCSAEVSRIDDNNNLHKSWCPLVQIIKLME